VEQVRHFYSSAIQDGFDRFHVAQRIACRLFLRLEHDPEATIRDVTTDKGFCRARVYQSCLDGNAAGEKQCGELRRALFVKIH